MSDPLVRREGLTPATGTRRARGRSERRRDDVREFLAFALGGERFALPLASIREILKVSQLTEVPRSKPWVLGILSVRGRITTIIDLRRRLRMSATPWHKQNRILLVDAGDEVQGLLVDEVFQVYRLQEDEVELAAVVAGDLSEYVLGIGRPGTGAGQRADPEELLVLLDPEPLLRR
ncbi:MAG: chemotaxis protein CheW [Sandaracinaceae bacterium]